jgi:succinoglycan biosynthesis protein ExoO
MMESTSRNCPFASIIIPTYNVERCLERAVRSALDQTFQDFEVIIIDDASVDGTVSLARKLAAEDKRIRVLPLASNGGPSTARNAGLDAAEGKWIVILDADDAFKPDRLAQLFAFCSQHQCDVIADDLVLFDQGIQSELGPCFQWHTPHLLDIDLLLQRDVYLRGQPLGWIKPVFRRSFLLEKNIRYPPQYRHAEDFYILASLLLSDAKFWLVPYTGYIYTLRTGTVSQEKSPYSASVPSMDNIADSCDEILARFDWKLNSAQRAGLHARKDRFRAGHHLDVARQHLKSGNPDHALKVLAYHPRAAILAAEQIFRKTCLRIKGK